MEITVRMLGMPPERTVLRLFLMQIRAVRVRELLQNFLFAH